MAMKLQYSMLDFVNYFNDKDYIMDIRSNMAKVQSTNKSEGKKKCTIATDSESETDDELDA